MSIVEVAKIAGTSHTTVSRVINGKPGVADDTAQAVRLAMEQIGYKPPTLRRGPKIRRPNGLNTRMIGVLLVGFETDLLHEPLVAEVIESVERTLREHQLGLVFGQVVGGERPPQNISKGTVDGLLMLGQIPEKELRKRFEVLPTVWLLTKRGSQADWGDRIRPDNAKSAEIAAEYLLDRGHRNLAFINPMPSHPAFVARQIAFRKFAEAHGAKVDVIEGYTMEGRDDAPELPWRTACNLLSNEIIDELVERMLSRSPRPTGIFVPADLVTAMVQRSLERHGVGVGKDVEIISCDNEQAALAGLDPRPTTVDLRPEVIGRRAVEQLLRRIEKPSEPICADIRVAPRLAAPNQ
jgi:DNA-binding LacI/PurR family transcriptional regulator